MTTGVSTSGNTLASSASTSAATTASSTSKSTTSKASLAQNFDTFLTMLTTQLKNQDPLSPMDSTQFTNQLVQFAGVEQQINVNSNLEKMISLTNLNQLSSSVSYLGQYVEMDSNKLPLQDGKAAFSYTLDADTRSTAIVIKDSTGQIVRSLAGETSSGRHEITWDGTDSSGNKLDDGAYTISIVAVDGEQKTVTTSNTVYGKVTDIANDSTEGTMLGLSGVVTTLSKVLTVRDPASVQSTSSTSTN